MKNKKLIYIITAIIVVIILIAAAIIILEKVKVKENSGNSNKENYITQLEDGTKINNSKELKSTKTYKEIEISNIEFSSKNERSTLIADIKNTSNIEFKEEEALIILLGENDEKLKEISIYIPSLKVGESKKINNIMTADVINAKNFKIEEKKNNI